MNLTYHVPSVADHQLATSEECGYHISANTSSRVVPHLDHVIQPPYSVLQVVQVMMFLPPSSAIAVGSQYLLLQDDLIAVVVIMITRVLSPWQHHTSVTRLYLTTRSGSTL